MSKVNYFFKNEVAVAQQVREEGRQEGREEGRQEGREKGREEGREKGRQEGREEGRQEGMQRQARNILQLLERRGVPVPARAADRIRACTDWAQLDTWWDRAFHATDTHTLFHDDA